MEMLSMLHIRIRKINKNLSLCTYFNEYFRFISHELQFIETF